ncbi:MAG: transposase [Bacteroidetes bacterium]|nr:transposase [Bacteroidota bacterium]
MATSLTFKAKPLKTRKSNGVYFLRTSKTDLGEKQFWSIYNTLTEIEATFRTLKTDLNLRPVYHKNDINCEAHIFLGILAYSIVNAIRHPLKQKNIHFDWSNIVRIMNTQKTVTNSMMTQEKEKLFIKTCASPSEK